MTKKPAPKKPHPKARRCMAVRIAHNQTIYYIGPTKEAVEGGIARGWFVPDEDAKEPTR